MNGIENRKCYWIESLAYCEPNKEPIVFESKSYGYIADSVREGRGYPYDKIFIPEGDTRTFSEMTEDEQLKTFDNKAYLDLLKYLINNNN
jgi:XTP/dITP diphosphohydrolase